MDVGLPMRDTNGACANGSKTALQWVPCCLQKNVALSLFFFHVSIINHTIANPVSI